MKDANIIHLNSVCGTKYAKECWGIYFLLQDSSVDIHDKVNRRVGFRCPAIGVSVFRVVDRRLGSDEQGSVFNNLL